MKKLFTVILIVLFQQHFFSQNAFENISPGVYSTGNAVPGWTLESGTNFNSYPCGGSVSWVPGSPDFSIMATPIPGTTWSSGPFNINNVTIGNSPLGGNNVARIQDCSPTGGITKLKTSYTVSAANSLFKIAFCGSWDVFGHTCCDRPNMLLKVFDCSGTALSCYSLNLTPAYNGCPGNPSYSVTNNVPWNDWQVSTIDFSPLIGSCVRIEITNNDCSSAAHHGSAYVDVDYGNSYSTSAITPVSPIVLPVNYCQNSGVATLMAPLGYYSYSWTGPSGYPVSPSQSTLSAITITNPVPGNVYQVNLTTPVGCIFTASYTLAYSQVSAAGLGSSGSCSLGASGSASVFALGSGSGYNYTWLNSGNSVVGTSSVATNLLPGVYTVSLSAIGSAGCGTAAASVSVGVAPTGTYVINKDFCGNQVVLNAPPGSNRQWYYANAAISATAGGTAASYTVSMPSNGSSYWLSQISAQGCKDSVKYVLNQAPAGSFSINSSFLTCPNQSNATAAFTIVPSSTAPTGSNSIYVYSSGAPQYTAGIFLTSTGTLSAAGMPPGNYTVMATDGVCEYLNTFAVSNFTYNYQVSPTNATLCSGNSYTTTLNFSSPFTTGQYNYTVSPATYVNGGSQNSTNIFIHMNPVSSTGTSVTVYSVTVLPTGANCPITKTFTSTVISLPTPVITAISPFCTNASQTQVLASPTGGQFGTASGSWLSASGQITPSLTSAGTNTFMYAISAATCVASATGSFVVAQFNSAALTNPVANLCRNGAPLNLMSVVVSTVNGSWQGSPLVNGVFTPTVAAGSYPLVYSTISSGLAGLCNDQSTLTVNVYNTPTLSLLGNTVICKGETTTITAQGANTYSFNASGTGSLIVLSPTTNMSYSITGSSNNCSSTRVIAIVVNPCTGFEEMTGSSGSFRIFPNPNQGILTIVSEKATRFKVTNELGQEVFHGTTAAGNQLLDLSALKPGIYFISPVNDNALKAVKIVITN